MEGPYCQRETNKNSQKFFPFIQNRKKIHLIHVYLAQEQSFSGYFLSYCQEKEMIDEQSTSSMALCRLTAFLFTTTFIKSLSTIDENSLNCNRRRS